MVQKCKTKLSSFECQLHLKMIQFLILSKMKIVSITPNLMRLSTFIFPQQDSDQLRDCTDILSHLYIYISCNLVFLL